MAEPNILLEFFVGLALYGRWRAGVYIISGDGYHDAVRWTGSGWVSEIVWNNWHLKSDPHRGTASSIIRWNSPISFWYFRVVRVENNTHCRSVHNIAAQKENNNVHSLYSSHSRRMDFFMYYSHSRRMGFFIPTSFYSLWRDRLLLLKC